MTHGPLEEETVGYPLDWQNHNYRRSLATGYSEDDLTII